MDITYCYEHCQIGKAASEKFLEQNNSVFDAAFDFNYFVEKCFDTCQYKNKHTKETDT